MEAAERQSVPLFKGLGQEISVEEGQYIGLASADGPMNLKRLATTGAPVSCGTPRIIADAPCKLIFAPIRASSGTCMKRFSNIVSVIIDAPSAIDISDINWACMSVGKAGKGAVLISTARIRFSRISNANSLSKTSTFAPASLNFSITASSSVAFIPRIFMRP